MRFAVAVVFASAAYAQVYPNNLPTRHPAIEYATRPLSDPVALLAEKLERGKTNLEFREGGLGYLPSLLERLGVNPDSQALVFSKTSFQAGKISPRNPRAIYFGDDVAVGWVRGGTGFELAALDPKQGVIFYTMDIQKAEQPRLLRSDACLRCHIGPATLGVPGVFIGSVYPDASGAPQSAGAIITDHRTPFADRWGGWYVNATRGEQPDRANALALDPAEPQVLQPLLRRFDPAGYLTPTSDIVALMTFEHQTQMTNLMTRLGWEARIAQHDRKRFDDDVEGIVDYMLFADEAPLSEPVEGVSTFTKTFPERGPRDKKGRSLRDFDLQKRLFRYPLSYMIYSAAFDGMPDSVRERIYGRLYEVLSGKDQSRKFTGLSSEDRRAILEIVRDTKVNLPAYWRR
ncbi:MAG TPA: hypothetical protein VKU01_23510 [Bryobacteraceae bacterium]|nr:hypothetical protein [Bryobacteraceae bacterium]